MRASLALLILIAACASPAPTSSSPPPPPPPSPPSPVAVDAAVVPPPVAAPDAAPVAVAPPDAAPRPTTCTADADHCCEPDGTIVEVACSPRPKDNRPQRTHGSGGWCAGCYKKCLPAHARIDTPLGAIAVSALHAGDRVWTLDAAGARVAVAIVAVRSIAAPSDHQVLRLTLADGRVVAGSAGHPTADGRWLGALAVGATLDGAEIVAIDAVPLGGDATWDLLPGGATGAYWSDGVLLGSTLLGAP